MESSRWKSNGAREVSEKVMTKSSMWFLLWAGKFTCWLRLKEERRDRNLEVRWAEGLSGWMLKSPVMMNSWGVVAAKERKELKSSRKMENGLEGVDAVKEDWHKLHIHFHKDVTCSSDFPKSPSLPRLGPHTELLYIGSFEIGKPGQIQKWFPHQQAYSK